MFQSVVAHRLLLRQLSYLGALDKSDVFERHEVFETAFKNIWADNADEMSRRYTGVGALKTDFTRTGKRTGKGLVQDGLKSVQRMAQHMLKDTEKQKCIDQFLGQVHGVARSSPLGLPTTQNFPALEGLLVDVDHAARALLLCSTALQVETRVPLDTVFSVAPVLGTAGAVRVWLNTQPDPIRIPLRSTSVRADFVHCVSLLAPLPRPPPDVTHLDVMALTWHAPSAPVSPQATFGHLPKAAAIIVLALQNVAYSLPDEPETPPLVQSGGMTAECHFVACFRSYLGAEYELMQCVGGGCTRLALFARINVLPFLVNVYGCLVGSAPLAPAGSATVVDSLTTPTKSFSSLVKEKMTAVRQQMQPPATTAPENAIGCALRVSVMGLPLCFFTTGGEVSAGSKNFVYLFGRNAAAFDAYNALSVTPHTYWLGSASPHLFDVSAWLCLASNDAVRGHVLSLSPVTDLLSSDPPERAPVSASSGALASRAVACCFYVPVHLSAAGVRVQLTLQDIHVSSLSEVPSSPPPHLVLSSPCAMDNHFGHNATPPSQALFWLGPFNMLLLLSSGGSEWVTVDVYSERTHLARGRLMVQDAFAMPEASLVLRSATGALWGHCKVHPRAVVVPSPPMSGLGGGGGGGGAAAAPPPVPQRPPKGDLINFSAPNSLSPALLDF